MQPLNDTKKLTGPLDEDGRKTGRWVAYHPDGSLAEEVFFDDDVPHGTAKVWNEDGTLLQEMPFRKGKAHGVNIEFYPDGMKASELSFLDGVPHGRHRFWHRNGKLAGDGGMHLGRGHGACMTWLPDDTQPKVVPMAYGVPTKAGAFGFTGILKSGWMSVAAVLIVALIVGMSIYRDSDALTGVVLLGIALVVHEFGHFLVARLVGIPIVEFRIGFGPQLFGFMCCGTEFTVHLVPLIGWVREPQFRTGEAAHFAQIRRGQSEPTVADAEALTALPDEMPAPASKFVSRPKQVAFLTGGVAMNFLLAFVALWVTLGANQPVAALQRSAELTGRILAVVPEAVGEQLKPANYTGDRPGLLRGSRDASREGVPLGVHMALINILFVAFNILPVPPLDGFRIVVVMIEAIIRRSIPDRIITPVYLLGWLLIMVLMVSGVWFLGRDLIQMMLGA